MERILRKFSGFAAAEAAEEAELASLTPQQRVDLLLEMIARYRESLGDAGERFERVHRVVELSKS